MLPYLHSLLIDNYARSMPTSPIRNSPVMNAGDIPPLINRYNNMIFKSELSIMNSIIAKLLVSLLGTKILQSEKQITRETDCKERVRFVRSPRP